MSQLQRQIKTIFKVDMRKKYFKFLKINIRYVNSHHFRPQFLTVNTAASRFLPLSILQRTSYSYVSKDTIWSIFGLSGRCLPWVVWLANWHFLLLLLLSNILFGFWSWSVVGYHYHGLSMLCKVRQDTFRLPCTWLEKGKIETNFYKKMSLKNPRIWRELKNNLYLLVFGSVTKLLKSSQNNKQTCRDTE